MPIMLFLILILIFVVLLVVVTNIVIVPQSMSTSSSVLEATPRHGAPACTLKFRSSSGWQRRSA